MDACFILFLLYCVVWRKHWERLICCLLQTFSNLIACVRKFISLQSYWSIFYSYWSLNILIFDFFVDFFQCFHGFSATVITYAKQFLLLFCVFIVAFCFWSIQDNQCMIHHVKGLSYDSYDCNPSTWSNTKPLPSIDSSRPFFISIQKWIRKLLDDVICIFVDHNYYTVALSMQHSLFITVCWWHEFKFHGQLVIRHIF